MSRSELPIDRANRKLRNKGRGKTRLIETYADDNLQMRELRLHVTKGYRDVRAS